MRSRPVLTLLGMFGVLAYVSLLSVVDANTADAREGGSHDAACRDPYPDGFDGFLVFMANGSVPLSDGFFLDGTIFQTQIMKRTPAQIAQNRAEALDYFETRFGIVDPETNPDVGFFGFYADPRINYRAYVISGRQVPSEGFEVADGGWIVLVTNPSGLDLGGAYAGVHVPVNTVFSFGDYNIRVTRPGRGHGPQPAPIIIHYRCNDPLIPLLNGGEAFNCDLTSDEFGDGIAQGITTPVIENGVLRPNGRTVLTFSDDGGF